MLPPGYPVRVKTIEAIRMANLKRLEDELREGGLSTDKAVAKAMGISAPYLSQMKTLERGAIGSTAARKIERTAEKPEGWMDTDFDLWPFPDADLLAQVERLVRDQRIAVQHAIWQALDLIEKRKAVPSGKSTTSQESATKAGPRNKHWLPDVQEEAHEEGNDVQRVQDQKNAGSAGRSRGAGQKW